MSPARPLERRQDGGTGRLTGDRAPNPRLGGSGPRRIYAETGLMTFPRPFPPADVYAPLTTPPGMESGDVVFLAGQDLTPVYPGPIGSSAGVTILLPQGGMSAYDHTVRATTFATLPTVTEIGWAQGAEAWPYVLGAPMNVESDYVRGTTDPGLQRYGLVVFRAQHPLFDTFRGFDAAVLGAVTPSWSFTVDPELLPLLFEPNFHFVVAFTDTGAANHLTDPAWQGWAVEVASDHVVIVSHLVDTTMSITLPAAGGPNCSRFVWGLPLDAAARGLMRGAPDDQLPQFNPPTSNPLA